MPALVTANRKDFADPQYHAYLKAQKAKGYKKPRNVHTEYTEEYLHIEDNPIQKKNRRKSKEWADGQGETANRQDFTDPNFRKSQTRRKKSVN